MGVDSRLGWALPTRRLPVRAALRFRPCFWDVTDAVWAPEERAQEKRVLQGRGASGWVPRGPLAGEAVTCLWRGDTMGRCACAPPRLLRTPGCCAGRESWCSGLSAALLIY